MMVGLLCTGLAADIFEIKEIEKILPAIDSPDTLVLFDMDDTLTDSTTMLGTGQWRKSLREESVYMETLREINAVSQKDKLHDNLTHFVALHVPVKPVEEKLPAVVQELQKKVPVLVFTARGKKRWYSSDIAAIDLMTEAQLTQAGYSFHESILPKELQELDPATYGNGILYTSPLKKGAFLKDLIQKTGYRPAKIVFIDDKLEQVQSVEKAAQELGIPYVGFWYTRAENVHEDFNEDVAARQLISLISEKTVLSDVEATAKEGGPHDLAPYLEAFAQPISVY